jgi:[ribosomal protein S18]-alanine N-acetyltransferase
VSQTGEKERPLLDEAIRMVGEYAVRRCSAADIPTVMLINERTLPEHYSDVFYYDLLDGFPEGFLVVELRGSVVGYMMNRVEFGFSNIRGFSLTKKAHVVSVAVLKDHQRKGLGIALMEEGHRAMVAKGCKEVFLEVRAGNEPAVELYKKLGYSVTQRLYSYYRDGEDAFLMSRGL